MRTPKTHDADLCERIRELEKRVEELEAQPRTVVYPSYPFWPYTGTPWWGVNPPNWWISPNTTTITYAKGVSTDSTTYVVGDIQ